MKTLFAKEAGIGAAASRLRALRIRRLLENFSEDTTLCFEPCPYTVESNGAFSTIMYIPGRDEDTEKQAAFALRHHNHVTLLWRHNGIELANNDSFLFPHAPAFGIVHQEVQQ